MEDARHAEFGWVVIDRGYVQDQVDDIGAGQWFSKKDWTVPGHLPTGGDLHKLVSNVPNGSISPSRGSIAHVGILTPDALTNDGPSRGRHRTPRNVCRNGPQSWA